MIRHHLSDICYILVRSGLIESLLIPKPGRALFNQEKSKLMQTFRERCFADKEKRIRLLKRRADGAAFVSTNSICQGEQVITFWKYIIGRYHAVINFAYSTFVWDSEATDKAKVHCVIVGFSLYDDKKAKHIYEESESSQFFRF